ncbi:zinc finger protein [Reticulomyxa filosa]|uniref:Zinc finger protein n=1 Tax=Reticulomyxa filosa TaxID=46433 RepID=X6LC10_RETFI|nr:zinc finger protein [Reticulomyxa filosa]|eukprot:ETN98860.1 zinc finger protein [Reticulomyxa filosa]
MVAQTKKETRKHQRACFQKIYRCVKCFILALTKKEIHTHSVKWHGLKNKPKSAKKKKKKETKKKTPSEYRCDECGKMLKKKGLLTKHVIGVHKKPFICPYETCRALDKRFGEKRRLRTHIQRFHLKVREVCEFCKKYYYDEKSLQKHINDVHLKMRQYVCIVCRKCFTRFVPFFTLNFFSEINVFNWMCTNRKEFLRNHLEEHE